MKRFVYLLLALSIACVISCRQEVISPVGSPDNEIILYASNIDFPSGKTQLQENGAVSWTPGDEISVFYQGESARFTAQCSTPSASAQFKGKLNGYISDAQNSLWAVYPYSEGTDFDGTAVSLTIPWQQVAVAGSFQSNAFYSIAKSANETLGFYNVCGGVRFKVSKEGIHSVTLSGNNGETLSGSVKVEIGQDGKPFVSQIVDGRQSVTLTASEEDSFIVGEWYYIVTLPANLNNGYTLSFLGDTQTKDRKNENAISIKRSVWGSLPSADPAWSPEDTISVVLPESSSLKSRLDRMGIDANQVKHLIISGALSDNDLYMLSYNMPNLKHLDLRSADSESFYCASRTVECLYLPDSMTVLPASALTYCSNLKYVYGANVVVLENRCLSSCSKLEDYYLPKVETIKYEAFSGCSSLTKLFFQKATLLESRSFVGCNSVREAAFDSLEELTSRALDGWWGPENLESLSLPNLKIAGENEFSYLAKLKVLHLPNAVKIGRGLINNSSIEEINCPSLNTIPASCFAGCLNLRSAYFKNAAVVGESAFQGCERLKNVSLPHATDLESKAFYGCTLGGELDFTMAQFIGNNCFENSTGIGSQILVLFPMALWIGERAFANCTGLSMIAIPLATIIKGQAFAGCTALSVFSPDNVLITTSLGDYAFKGCKALATLKFPQLTDLGSGCFEDSGLRELSFGALPWYKTDEDGWFLPPFDFCTFPISQNITENIHLHINSIDLPPVFDEHHPWWSKDWDDHVLFMRRKWAGISEYQ